MANGTLKNNHRDDGRTRTCELAFFAAAGLFLIIVIVAAFVSAHSGEWEDFQLTYRKLAADYARNSAQHKLASKMEIGYRQFFLPKLNRIDRCTTCHLGIENPEMADAPQPFTLHSGDYLKHHRPDRFGCTVCHQGQGLATNVKEAHGHVKHWPSPMFAGEYLQAGCGRCHQGYQPLPGAPVLSLGRKIFREEGCLGCHRIRKQGGNVGPELTGIAQKDVNGDGKLDTMDWDWHFRHFKSPHDVSPNSAMPSFGLSDDEVKALTTLVLSFSSEDIQMDYIVPGKPRPLPHTAVERGALIYEGSGCAGCHGKDGIGKRPNPNAESGNVVPSLTKVREGYNVDEVLVVLEKGKETPRMGGIGPKPPLDMPPWKDKLSESELKDLIEYIFSLAPHEEDDWDE